MKTTKSGSWTKDQISALTKIAKLAEKHAHGQKLNWLYAFEQCRKEVTFLNMDNLQISKAWFSRKRIIDGKCMRCGKPNSNDGNLCKKCAKLNVESVLKYRKRQLKK